MSVVIQCEELFKNKLKTGINLFTGSGFSVLESPNGDKLPTGEQLCGEIIEYFALPGVTPDDGLSYVCEFCSESEYQQYLRQRFSVASYNPLYDAIMKINLKSVVTTNIDNIIRKVVDNDDNYYIQNIREYGAPTNSPNELIYIPIHGDVADVNSKLFFGKFELSDVDTVNGDLFKQMYSVLSDQPVLFWGYSFNDNGVLKVVKELIEKWHSNIWVQVYPGDEKNKRLFEGKGCHIIEAKTDELLKWVAENVDRKDSPIVRGQLSGKLKKYKVPSLTQVPSVPAKDFFQQGVTDWYPILTGETVERDLISEVENIALTDKTVIISGGRYTGKTTALMQLARKVDAQNKLYVESLTSDEALFIKKNLNGESAWVFYNNCCRDVEAFLILARCPNINVVGTSDDYILETVRHLLSQNIKYHVFNCNELSRSEALRIYQKIPAGIKKPQFTYKSEENDKYSFLEFTACNIRNAHTKRHVMDIFEHLYKKDLDSFKIITLAFYLSEYGSAMSYQNVAHMLEVSIFPDALNKTSRALNYLRHFNIDYEEEGQDYYILRSKIFAYNARQVLLEKYRDIFGEIVKKLALKESIYSILRYDIFRRKSFDSGLFYQLFSYDEAVSIYKAMYEMDRNPYILQQLALCRGLFGDYADAFADIDKAVNSKPNNFSFKNSQAILLFESNHHNYADGSLSYMIQAMSMLEECYNNDKRKLYHAQKYAQFAIIMFESYGQDNYLPKAQMWLLEMIESGASESYKTKGLLEKITNILSKRAMV